MSNDDINRVNHKIRETIKKYNDILSDLINKNLHSYMQAKTKKSKSVEEILRVLEEERKNNEKVEERLEI